MYGAFFAFLTENIREGLQLFSPSFLSELKKQTYPAIVKECRLRNLDSERLQIEVNLDHFGHFFNGKLGVFEVLLVSNQMKMPLVIGWGTKPEHRGGTTYEDDFSEENISFQIEIL